MTGSETYPSITTCAISLDDMASMDAIYRWNCAGIETADLRSVEMAFYQEHFDPYIRAMHRRKAGRSSVRTRDMSAYYAASGSRPECIEICFGPAAGAQLSIEDNIRIAKSFINWRKQVYPRVEPLDYVVTIRDGMPYVFERHVWLGRNQQGYMISDMATALVIMRVRPPEPDRAETRQNSPRAAYDDMCARSLALQVGWQIGLKQFQSFGT